MNDLPLSDVVFYWIDRTIRRAKDHTKQVFKEHGFGITIDQWILMKRLNDEPGLSQRELAKSTYKDPAAVTRMIDILSRKGLAQRIPRPEDRRAYELQLTQEGQNLVNKMIPVVQELRAGGLKGLTEEQISCLRSSLNLIYENIEEQMR